MPRPTTPGPPPASSAAGKPASYLAAQSRASGRFRLRTDFSPQGDQEQAIGKLVAGLPRAGPTRCSSASPAPARPSRWRRSSRRSTGPTLVLSHNKTLAAQLYQEFRNFFPENAVEYFVSYYDYYQPEAYIPQNDLYIEKEMTKNDEIDKLRLAATKALFERRDVIIVASVSCIYGIGDPDLYFGMLAVLRARQTSKPMTQYLAQLAEMQYERTPYDLARGNFRVRGDVLELWPAYEDDAVRIEFFGDEIDKITRIDPITGTPLRQRRPPGDLSRARTTSRRARRLEGDGEHPRRARRARGRAARRPNACSKRSGSRSARCSTSR